MATWRKLVQATGTSSQYIKGDGTFGTYSASGGTTTASNTQTFTNKSGNISQWTNDSGYLTSHQNISGKADLSNPNFSSNVFLGTNSGGNRWINLTTTTGESGITWYETSTYSVPNHTYGAQLFYDESADALKITTRQAGSTITHMSFPRASTATDWYGALRGRSGATIRLYEANDGNYVALDVPTLSANYTLTLPTTDGGNGQALQSDGNGNLSWAEFATESYSDNYTDNAIDNIDNNSGNLDIPTTALLKAQYGILGCASTTTSSGYKILGTSYLAVSTTYYKVQFKAPQTGKVFIQAQVHQDAISSGRYFYYDFGTSTPSGYCARHRIDETDDVNQTVGKVITGLTSGTTYTYYLYARLNATSGYIRWGSSYGSPYMIVTAINA